MAVEVGKPGTNWTQISPEHRRQMAPLVEHYRKSPHPFAACVRDNRKRFPAPGQVERICAVLKDVIEQSTHWRRGRKHADAEGLTVLREPALTPDELEALAALSAEFGDRAYAELTARARKKIPVGSFALPGSREYPIHDRAHAANALARASGKPEYAKVRAACCRRYPDLPACKARSMSEIGEDAESDREARINSGRMMSTFDESRHPRIPKGNPGGGRWIHIGDFLAGHDHNGRPVSGRVTSVDEHGIVVEAEPGKRRTITRESVHAPGAPVDSGPVARLGAGDNARRRSELIAEETKKLAAAKGVEPRHLSAHSAARARETADKRLSGETFGPDPGRNPAASPGSLKAAVSGSSVISTPDEGASAFIDGLRETEKRAGKTPDEKAIAEARATWAKRIKTSIETDPKALAVVRDEQAYNATSKLQTLAEKKYGPDAVLVIKDGNVDALLSPGRDLAAAKRMTGNRVTVVRREATIEKRTGPTEPGDTSTLSKGGVAGLLRHEYGHQIFEEMTVADREAFRALLPDAKTIRAELTAYGSGGPSDAQEAFSELYAVVSDPGFDASRWAPWVNEARSLIESLLSA